MNAISSIRQDKWPDSRKIHQTRCKNIVLSSITMLRSSHAMRIRSQIKSLSLRASDGIPIERNTANLQSKVSLVCRLIVAKVRCEQIYIKGLKVLSNQLTCAYLMLSLPRCCYCFNRLKYFRINFILMFCSVRINSNGVAQFHLHWFSFSFDPMQVCFGRQIFGNKINMNEQRTSTHGEKGHFCPTK